MGAITLDFTKAIGTIKPLHATMDDEAKSRNDPVARR